MATTPNPTLESAITSAVDTQAAPPPEPAPVETPVETPAETTPVEPAAPAAPDDAELQANALHFYKALQNPETMPAMVEFLAKQAGLEVRAPAPKETPKEPGVGDLLTQHLGEEYAFLAPKLGPAIEAVLNAQIAPLREQLLRSQVSSEFDRAVASINEETKGDFRNYEKDVVSAMQRIRPAEGTPIKEYLSDMYALVKAKKGTAPLPADQVKQVVQKIHQNAQEILPSPSAATDSRVMKGPNLPTLDEAIAAAIKGITFE